LERISFLIDKKKRRLVPPIMGEEKILRYHCARAMYSLYMRGIFFYGAWPIFFGPERRGGGGGMPEEGDSRDFYGILYGRGAVTTVAAAALAMILFTLWE
jgi:hypothetical protein